MKIMMLSVLVMAVMGLVMMVTSLIMVAMVAAMVMTALAISRADLGVLWGKDNSREKRLAGRMFNLLCNSDELNLIFLFYQLENIDDWSNGRSGKSLTVQMVMAAAEQTFIGQRDLGSQLARAEFLRQVEEGKVMGERMFQEMVEVARGEGDKEFRRRLEEGRLEGEEEFKKQVAHSYV